MKVWRQSIQLLAVLCSSATRIFTWASPRHRPAPYVVRQPWQVVTRTASRWAGTKGSVDRSCTQTYPLHAPASRDSAQHEHTQHEHTSHRRTAQGPHSARAHTSGPRKSRRCACILAHFLPGCRPDCARARALLSHALKLHLSGTRSARSQVPAAAASSPRPPGPGALKPRLVLQRPCPPAVRRSAAAYRETGALSRRGAAASTG